MPRHCFFDTNRPCTLDCQAAYERDADVPGCYFVWSASKVGWLADEVRENVDPPRSGVWGLFFRRTLEISVGEDIRRHLLPQSFDGLKDVVSAVRELLAEEMGLVLPVVHVEQSFELPADGYAIQLRGTVVAEGTLVVDRLLCLSTGDARLDTVPGRPATDPAYGYPAKWIEPHQQDEAEGQGYHVLDPLSVIHNHLYAMCVELAGEIFSLDDLQKLLQRAREYFPELVSYAVPKVLSEAELFAVLQRLLREGVPINTLDVILQTLLIHVGQGRDPVVLTEQVRKAMARTICVRVGERYHHADKVPALTLEDALEDELRGSLRREGPGTGFALSDERREHILHAVDFAIQRTEFRPAAGRPVPPVLIVSADLRPFVFGLISDRISGVPVLCRDELVEELPVEVLDAIGAPA